MHSRHRDAFTLMEATVVTAAVLVILTLAIPGYAYIRQKQHSRAALGQLQSLARAASTYANQMDGALPQEDVPGTDNWQNVVKPESKDAWYNALPKLMGKKSAADYASDPRTFYTPDNSLYVPGAAYPTTDEKLIQPLFAVAFNTKLHRKDERYVKRRMKISEITSPSRTVLFLEQGLPGETPTLEVQKKKDYDGSPKGSAKSFIGRYRNKGAMAFADGRVELVDAKDVLSETGDFPFPQTDYVWTPSPDEDPNK